LTDFTDAKAANVLTAALRSNRNVRRVQIKVAEDIFLPVMWDLCCTGFLPSLVKILEALEERESLEDLTFKMVDLAPPEHAAAVRRLLQSTPGLKKLEFYCCHLSLDESMAIAEGLRDSPSSLEILSVIHCLRPGNPIERASDSSLRAWSHRVGDKWFDHNYNEIAIALVEGTSQGDHNSLKVLNLEGNELADWAMERIIYHLTENEAPLENISPEGNDVGIRTSLAIAGLLVNSKTLTMVNLWNNDSRHFSGDHSVARRIVREGLRYNFNLEEFNINDSVFEREVQRYLLRNRIGREAIQNERRDQWLELLIQHVDDLSALYYYLRKCPAWIYGHAD
jgi:hypothetical protein